MTKKNMILRENGFLILSVIILIGCSQGRDIERSNSKQILEEEVLAIGCENATYDDWERSAYVLPFPVGESYAVTLSHCGGSYHSAGEPDQFAIDFDMPISTDITASRSGRVVFVEASGIDGGFPNNLVVVKHDDGTFAQYMHLTQNGALVKSGEEVVQGQRIALSGNTGLAGFPHLHFVVTNKGFGYPYESIPTTFKNTSPNERSLASWTRYTAFPYD